MENEGLFATMQEKHVAQVTETILLIWIINTSRQQSTSNNSNSTFNSAQLTDFPARTADETPKSLQSVNTLLLNTTRRLTAYYLAQRIKLQEGIRTAEAISVDQHSLPHDPSPLFI
ncbi:hypothetical protein AVEN_217115-1 [Araneus ventricosus]|uniref:Uncharacterized protein n=1 Tax=Araneus ventricosus TaxID=182803 RepID=A0A4Y2E5W5_ARAVE|nr:hypothetical protein AVEN_217115-1 [Araneus ventricosus]